MLFIAFFCLKFFLNFCLNLLELVSFCAFYLFSTMRCNLHLGIHVFAADYVSYDCCIGISFLCGLRVLLSKAYYCSHQCWVVYFRILASFIFVYFECFRHFLCSLIHTEAMSCWPGLQLLCRPGSLHCCLLAVQRCIVCNGLNVDSGGTK